LRVILICQEMDRQTGFAVRAGRKALQGKTGKRFGFESAKNMGTVYFNHKIQEGFTKQKKSEQMHA